MSSTTSLYLKEHEHLRSSERLVDDQISIAIATKEHLVAQRARLNHALNRLQITLQRFPLVNNALQKINLRRRRDAIIVGAVIGICFILLFLYVFH